MTKLTLGDFDFFLYYLDSLKSDWQNFYYDSYYYDSKYCYLDLEKIERIESKTINIIIKHLNKQEFKRFMKILNKLDDGLRIRTSKRINLPCMFFMIFKHYTKEDFEQMLKDYKYK